MSPHRLRPRRPCGPVWLVAMREIRTLLRSKAFLIGNAVLVAAMLIGGVVGALLSDDEPFRLGVANGAAADVAELAATVADQFTGTDGGSYELVEVDDPDAARASVADGDLDGVLLSPGELVVDTPPPMLVRQTLNAARQLTAVDTALAEAGLGAVERETVLRAEPVSVTTLGQAPQTPPREGMVAVGSVLILYLLLMIYGSRVAQSIVEEKASRVVEVVLAAIRPAQLLSGKVAGIGALSLLQALALAALAGGVVAVVLGVAPTAGDAAVIGWVVAWYVPGYALYAMLFAVVGALMPREQDMQSAATPVFVLVVLGMVGTQATLFNPQSTMSQVTGLVPFTAPMVQPLRMVSGAAGAWEVAAAAALTLATVAALVPVAGRLYAGGVLHTRTKVSLRRAWAGADQS